MNTTQIFPVESRSLEGFLALDSSMASVGERIRKIRREKEVTQASLGEAVELTDSAISRIERGDSDPGADLLHRIARALGVSAKEFFEDEKGSPGDIVKPEPPLYSLGGSSGADEIELVTIPVYEHVQAGTKNMIFETPPVDYIAIPVSSDKTRFGVKVKGDSMEPAIVEGDVVVVSKIGEPRSGDPCLVNFSDGEFVLRYVFFSGDIVTLTAGNRKYPPVTIQRHQIKSLLRVVARSSGADQLRMR